MLEPREIIRRARRIVAPLSPSHRRWRRFLWSLPLDPDALPSGLESPGENDFIICGPSRSGTTLLTAQLFQPPTVVTVMEPWDGMRMPPAQLFASLRDEIERSGHLSRGRLDVTALREEGVVRWCQEDDAVVRIPELGDGYRLGVKWPVYWRFISRFPDTKFLVCIRHPYTTINSFKKTGGRLGSGLDYPTRFNEKMNAELRSATRDPRLRRVLLYEHACKEILPYLKEPNVLPVRYERWFDDEVALMDDIATFLGIDLPAVPVTIRRPDTELVLTDQELEMIAEKCTVAGLLGYEL